MSAISLTASPVWTAAGWTMLHSLWVGAVLGFLAALVRRALKSTGPELRYGVALLWLAMLALSPALIFVQVYEPATVQHVSRVPLSDGASSRIAPGATADLDEKYERLPDALVSDRSAQGLTRPQLAVVIPILPWFWLCGSSLTLVMLAAGLIGVEQMRRSSRMLDHSDITQRCHTLAVSLGIAQHVSVRICDRLAMPILLGIVRPMILLPPTALYGWSIEQLEMVLVHELAHLRRWDNLVNLLQRVVESLLFFQPVVWWLSGWARLERELCCDRYVVDRLGQPVAYAEMLVALSGMSRRPLQTVLAMADRQVITRIRRLFNLEERSMKLSMPEGLGMLGATVVGVLLVLGSQEAQTKAVDDLQKTARSVPVKPVDDLTEIPDIEAIPLVELLSFKDGSPAPRPPINARAVSLFARDTRRLVIIEYPISPDGATTYRCRGGIEILCESSKFGTVRLEADEARIKRMKPKSDKEPTMGQHGETWFEGADVPMEVHLKGNAVVRQDKDKPVGTVDARIVRAPELDYDCVTGLVVAPSAKPEPSVARFQAPIVGAASKVAREPAVPGWGERSISLSPRNNRPTEITDLPRELDGTVKYVCRGGIRIVIKTEDFGTLRIEADEAVIVRKCRFGPGETVSRTSGGSWIEDDDVPMEIDATGNVIWNQSWEKAPGEVAHLAALSDQVRYDAATGHLSAKNVKIDGPGGSRITATGMEFPARSMPTSKPVSRPSTSSRTTGASDARRQPSRPPTRNAVQSAW